MTNTNTRKVRDSHLVRGHVTDRQSGEALAHAVVGLQQCNQRLETIVAFEINELGLHGRIGGQVRKVHGRLATLVERAVGSASKREANSCQTNEEVRRCSVRDNAHE